MKTRAEIRAQIRDDFIRRLFSVAISVGFAATLIKMDWVKSATFPTEHEWEQLAILGTGFVATALSWDGYLVSIQKKPLLGFWRFAIDILLVFIYMFFLISSSRGEFWLPLLALIFSLYAIWDWLTVKEHMPQYDSSFDPSKRATNFEVLKVYLAGFKMTPSIDRGPIITLSWSLYFIGLAWINLSVAKYQVFIMSGLATVGLILYRCDKNPNDANGERGFHTAFRFAAIAMLLSISALLFCRFGGLSSP